MRADGRAVRRLQRLEKLRDIARREAARDAAQAEGTLARMQRLADRTRTMSDTYRQRPAPADGMELRELAAFLQGMNAIVGRSQADAAQAQAVADRKLSHLTEAERRRDAVAQRATAARILLDRADPYPAAPARPRIGMALE